jgi:hypothetical protein
VIEVALEGDLQAVLRELPRAPGVAQLLGAGGKSLLLGRAANLRRWAAKSLGGGKPSRKTGRPALDLRGIATSVAFQPTTSEFHQRLVFERRMAGLVPLAKRRDLKPAAFLHLDPAERFPRVSVRSFEGLAAGLFGPFRDRRAAERARDALHKLHPLRPCDYVFEPDPNLPLGLGCLFAQVRSCAAPCLARVSEDGYRALAREASRLLAGELSAEVCEWLPGWIGPLADARGLVVEQVRASLELYPVIEGALVEEASALVAAAQSLEAAIAKLRFERPEPARDDTAWLSAWLYGTKRKGHYFVIRTAEEQTALAARVRDKLGAAERP